MKTMNSSHASGCPDTETLAEFAVNPDPALFPDMAAHIRECAHCRAIARQHRMIARALETACVPPEGLADRVRSAVCRDAQVRSRRFRGLWYGAAAAAVVMLSLHAVFVNWNSGRITATPDASLAMAKHSAEEPAETDGLCCAEAPAALNGIAAELCDNAAPLPQAPVPAEPQMAKSMPVGSSVRMKANPARIAQQESRTPVNNLEFARPVAAQFTPEFGFGDESAFHNVRHRAASNVAHIWKASSPFSFQAAAARHQCTVLSVNTSHAGYDVYTLQGNDSSIQALVDDLYDNNWILYSADFPQPGQQPSTVFNETTVRYEMKVIR